MNIQAYGPPADWDALDLTEMGDLLVVLHRTDLSEISPTAARLAAPGLALNTRYTARLPGIRHFNTPTLQYEACEVSSTSLLARMNRESVSLRELCQKKCRIRVIGPKVDYFRGLPITKISLVLPLSRLVEF